MNIKRTAFLVLAAAFIVVTTITVGTIVSKNRAQDNESSTAASNTPQQPSIPPIRRTNSATTRPTKSNQAPQAQPSNLASTPQTTSSQELGPTTTARHIRQPSPPTWIPPVQGQRPRITAVMAQDRTKAVLIHFNEVVHIRGQVRLQTSGGPTAPAADEVSLKLNNMAYKATVTPGGSRTLRFPAGPNMKNTLHIQGITLDPGAAVRDEDGNDANTKLETPIPWNPGKLEPQIPDNWAKATHVSTEFQEQKDNSDQSPDILAITQQTATYATPNSSKPSTIPLWKIALDTPFQLNIQGTNPGYKLTARTSRILYYHQLPRSIQVKSAGNASTKRMWKELTIIPPDKDRFPTPHHPTHADCLWKISKSRSIDQIRLRTIYAADPQKLTDKERRDWHKFFSNNGYETDCNSFWSEPLTPGNAEKRNKQYSSCVKELKNREADSIKQMQLRKETLELVERPYLTLTLVEKHVLREKLGSNCERYYPQLYYGRWIPMPEEN